MSSINFIDKLHIIQHLLFTSLSCAFSKAPVIHQHYVIVVAVKIFGIFRPSFNTPGIAMKVENKTDGFSRIKMQAIDTNTWAHIKKIFPERGIILKLETLF